MPSKNICRQLSQQECLAELLFDNSRRYGEFKRGRVSLSDDPRVGAPKTAVTQENVDAVRKLIIEDRHNSDEQCIDKIIHYHLKDLNSKIFSRWIPHLFTEEQKAARVNCVKKRLTDESWIYCYEPENKRQSAVWCSKLRGQRFQSPEEAVDAFKNACFENWFERMQMCINLPGEYF
ncbi:unnamed protein product [Acanthoscelides obtectus]|uniref:Uncharacterized protein n=1 Tax=Acanthoscelides obtectus TaxID=200917 RepID=A0A9P0PMI5_ACAOB|nr:unnamed protein product [Acanthoscelides obtectus]CAK1637576.1 hypothetical protein AOBTE_LOCUS10064 [Acanthoscelides obtectus]